LSTANLLAGSNVRPTCLTLQGLSPGQARICELFRDHMPAVGAGAKAAITVSFCVCRFVLQHFYSLVEQN
uniref:Secreted protein n=1 Tax=Brugia timori TaxID=42155 RepID=A0A0R3R7B1_9BILA